MGISMSERSEGLYGNYYEQTLEPFVTSMMLCVEIEINNRYNNTIAFSNINIFIWRSANENTSQAQTIMMANDKVFRFV